LGQEDSGSTSERHRNRLRERIYDVIRQRYKRVGGILNQCRMATAHRMLTDARFDRLSIAKARAWTYCHAAKFGLLPGS
jgi:hypothetical protein